MAKQLWLPSFFCSGMILQQQVANLLHGCACPETNVRVTLDKYNFTGHARLPGYNHSERVFSAQTVCDSSGAFEIELPPLAASFDTYNLSITNELDMLTLQDILFGEIWIAGGQANMQMPISACKGSENINSLANLQYVRVLSQAETGLLKKKAAYSYYPHDDLAGAVWHRGDEPAAMDEVSAVGFSFVRDLHIDLKIPVGLIETALRSTYIHSWLSRESTEEQPDIKKHIVKLGYYCEEKDWNLTAGKDRARHQPAALFNSKVAPLRGLGARGVLWYHGENDCKYPDYYQKALKALVKDWHLLFRPADPRGLALLMVQLEPHFQGHRRFEQLAEFNEMLALTRHSLTCPSALVSIYDLPPDFIAAPATWRHPMRTVSKLPIGERLKTVSLGLLYRRKAPSSSPECSNVEVIGGKIMLSFSNIGNGLRLKGDDSRLRGFAICGPDRVFLEAQARILYGLKVLVWHEQISDPKAVTYAYADMNQHANLISRDHLAVVPFRSDREPSRYCPPMEWIHCESLRLWCCPHFNKPEETGWHPAWQIERGKGELVLEKANKAEGDGSILFRYQQANEFHECGLEPILHYDSLFPPLNLSFYSHLSIDVFNPDQQRKHLKLAVAAGQVEVPLGTLAAKIEILPALKWQRMQFDLTVLSKENLSAIRRLVILIEDNKAKGSLYLDNIRLIRPQ